MKQQTHSGFTIIEVMLFLAVSGFLIAGLILGTGASISNSRFQDSVQDVADFLRAQYASVVNPEVFSREVSADVCRYFDYLKRNPDGAYGVNSDAIKSDSMASAGSGGTKRGRSDCAVYGKVITMSKNSSRITVLPLIGRLLTGNDIVKYADSDDREVLRDINANVVMIQPAYKSGGSLTGSCSGGCDYFLGLGSAEGAQTHDVKWDATVTPMTDGDADAEVNESMTIIIFRSPLNGIVHTLAAQDSADIPELADTLGLSLCGKDSAAFTDSEPCNSQMAGGSVAKISLLSAFPKALESSEKRAIDICVRPYGLAVPGTSPARMISIAADGHNASSVDIVDRENEEGRNRCG